MASILYVAHQLSFRARVDPANFRLEWATKTQAEKEQWRASCIVVQNCQDAVDEQVDRVNQQGTKYYNDLANGGLDVRDDAGYVR